MQIPFISPSFSLFLFLLLQVFPSAIVARQCALRHGQLGLNARPTPTQSGPYSSKATSHTSSSHTPLPSPSLAPGISDTLIVQVRQQMLQIAQAPWEIGTAAEALLELDAPSLSVFNKGAFPPPTTLNSGYDFSDVLKIANNAVNGAGATFVPDNDSSDPSSMGVAVLLANWTRSNKNDMSYSKAAGRQIQTLLQDTGRTSSGAISHRRDQVQLWADFMYMAPPYIAYYGVLGPVNQRDYLQMAYDQCRLQRQELQDRPGGLWTHVKYGSWQDGSHWATGNAWAAAGMLRVYQTIVHSTSSWKMTQQRSDLLSWISEILNAAAANQHSDGSLLNTMDAPRGTSFPDSASTALLAAVAYRMYGITRSKLFLQFANRALVYVSSKINSNGLLAGTVDPLTFNSAGTRSPEGQAFVLLMHSAWRDLH